MADTVDPDPPPPPPEEVPPTVAVTQPVTPIPADAPPPRQGCMDKRSCLEKTLLVLIVIILIIVILCAAAFLVYYFFSSPPEGTCLSDNCVKAASRLKQHMDDDVDPCTNFYEYACGSWLKKASLSPNEDKLDTYSRVKDDYNINMRHLLEDRIGPDDPAYMTQPRLFYKGCTDMERINDRGAKPFLEFLDTVGQFPTLDDSWNSSQADFSLEQTIVKLAKLGETPLFSITVERDLKIQEAKRIYMGDAVLSLGNQASYKGGGDNPTLQQRKTWLVEALVLLGADQATAEADVDNIVQFETSLSEIMRDPVEKENKEAKYNTENIKLLNSEYTWLDWLEVFQGLGSNPKGGSVLIDDEEQIINQEPEYLTKLGKLLEDTDKRVLANYLMSSLIKYTAWLGNDFRRIYEVYMKYVFPNQDEPQYADVFDVPGMQRWKQCIKQTTEIFPESVSRLFVEQHFPKDAMNKMETMVKDLKKAFNDMIVSNTWMTVETKEKAEEKLKRLEAKVGYPAYLMDDERLNKLYEDIPTDELKYLETMVAYKKFKTLKNLQNVRERPDRKEWTKIFPASTDSGYNEFENDLTFPAALLQPPLFSADYPSSQNYASAGSLLAAEIIKGFGKNGSRYDGNGNINPWWSDEDKEGYQAQSICFVDQYGCYKWEGNSIDGELTLAENVADNGGLKQSYKAYRAMIKRSGSEEQRLPGLDLTHNQVFFLSFAQTWCAKVRDDLKESIVENGPHAPHPYRVYGSLQNSKEFSEAFKCPPGSRMNPMRKCRMF